MQVRFVCTCLILFHFVSAFHRVADTCFCLDKITPKVASPEDGSESSAWNQVIVNVWGKLLWFLGWCQSLQVWIIRLSGHAVCERNRALYAPTSRRDAMYAQRAPTLEDAGWIVILFQCLAMWLCRCSFLASWRGCNPTPPTMCKFANIAEIGQQSSQTTLTTSFFNARICLWVENLPSWRHVRPRVVRMQQTLPLCWPQMHPGAAWAVWISNQSIVYRLSLQHTFFSPIAEQRMGQHVNWQEHSSQPYDGRSPSFIRIWDGAWIPALLLTCRIWTIF